MHRKYVSLANNDDENLTPIASIQFEPESLFLVFSNRHQIYFYDWENDSILKVISAVPDTVVRFLKFLPGNSNYLLTTTTKPIVNQKLHETALEAYNSGNISKLLEIFMVIANFVLETTEQYKSGNSRCWSYSVGIQYFIRLFYQVTEMMEGFNKVTTEWDEIQGEGTDLSFTLNCMKQRINVIKSNYPPEWTNVRSKERCQQFFALLNLTDLTIVSDVINQIEYMFKDFEQESSKETSMDKLFLEYEKALCKDGVNMPRWPKIYSYVQYWNIKRELNLKHFHSNLVTVSGDATIAVANEFLVNFNPLLQVIEVISVRKENFGHRLHVLKNFPNFYYFFSVSPTQKILLIGFKKGLPGYDFPGLDYGTYGIFYELDKKNQGDEMGKFRGSKYRMLKTDKSWDINCLQFAPNPITGLIFGYNGPLMFRLVQ